MAVFEQDKIVCCNNQKVVCIYDIFSICLFPSSCWQKTDPIAKGNWMVLSKFVSLRELNLVTLYICLPGGPGGPGGPSKTPVGNASPLIDVVNPLSPLSPLSPYKNNQNGSSIKFYDVEIFETLIIKCELTLKSS